MIQLTKFSIEHVIIEHRSERGGPGTNSVARVPLRGDFCYGQTASSNCGLDQGVKVIKG